MRITPAHEQHYPDHLLQTRLEEYVFDDGRPPTMNRKAGAKTVTGQQVLDAANAAMDELKLTSIDPRYFVATAFHEAGCTNEWDTEIASPSCVEGYVSVGLYQIGAEEVRRFGFTLEDMLDLYKSTVCMVKLADHNRTYLRSVLGFHDATAADPAFTDPATGTTYPAGNMRAYLALAHNQGLGSAQRTIKANGMNWVGYMNRNPTTPLVAHRYGYDCITGGPNYPKVAPNPNGVHTMDLSRVLKLTTPWMRGDDVELAQSQLIAWRSDQGLENDGVFGPTTDRVVRLFQAARALPPDGEIGPETWKALFA